MNISEQSEDQLNAIIEKGNEASAELSRRYAEKSKSVKSRIKNIESGDFSQKFSDSELIYSASARCECGAGYAYPKNVGGFGSWKCSRILKGDETALPPVMHSGDLPFTFYEIKSEGQPSANGATTRPKDA